MRGKRVVHSRTNVLEKPGSQEWQTPKWIYNALNQEFGFDCDIATTPDNPLGAKMFFTKEDDALKQERWGKVNFCNPPHHLTPKFIEEAVEHAQRGETTVFFIPSRTGTRWFHKHLYNKVIGRYKVRVRVGNGKRKTVEVLVKDFADNVKVRFWQGRVQFTGPDMKINPKTGEPYPAGFDSMVVIIHGKRQR